MVGGKENLKRWEWRQKQTEKIKEHESKGERERERESALLSHAFAARDAQRLFIGRVL